MDTNYTDYLTDPNSVKCDMRLIGLHIDDVTVTDTDLGDGVLHRRVLVTFKQGGKGMYNVRGEGMQRVDDLIDFRLDIPLQRDKAEDAADFERHSLGLVDKLNAWKDASTPLRFYSEPTKWSVLAANRNDYIPVLRGANDEATSR